MVRPEANGNCFTEALTTAGQLVREGHERVLICHGRPTGRGVENKGKPFWHAWVEVKIHGQWVVFDLTAGQKTLPRALYYSIGHIGRNGQPLYRYTPAEALKWISEHEHAGPWVEFAEDDL